MTPRHIELFSHGDTGIFIRQANVALNQLTEQTTYAIETAEHISNHYMEQSFSEDDEVRSDMLYNECMTMQSMIADISLAIEIAMIEIKSWTTNKGRVFDRDNFKTKCLNELCLAQLLVYNTAKQLGIMTKLNYSRINNANGDLVIINHFIRI